MICFCGNFDKAVVNMAFMELNVTFRVLLTVKTPYAKYNMEHVLHASLVGLELFA